MEYSRHLPQETQADFALLSAELTRLHGITLEFHGRAWKDLTQGPEEDAIQWQVKMRFTLRAWLKDCVDRQSVFERVLLERYVSSLEPETERWTRNLRPKTSTEAAEIASLYQRNARPEALNQFRPLGPRPNPNPRNNGPVPNKKFGEKRPGRLPDRDPVKGPIVSNVTSMDT